MSACSTATHAIGLTLDYIRNGVVESASLVRPKQC